MKKGTGISIHINAAHYRLMLMFEFEFNAKLMCFLISDNTAKW